MYLWHRLATQKWWSDNAEQLRALATDRLAIIERPNRRRLQLEVACKSRASAQKLARQFRGRVQKLPVDWLKRISCEQKTKPLKIGKRLVIVRSPKDRQSIDQLIIPAGAAFGTGEHATTAMTLRLLENLTRKWTSSWSIVDFGTGSGILALAAKRFGATSVVGIDIDPIAIATAKENARLNKIQNVRFQLRDVRRWKLAHKVDIVAANLFSELLIDILRKLRHARWLIVSGIFSEQEYDVSRALKQNKIDIVRTRRRGKWVAILAAVT